MFRRRGAAERQEWPDLPAEGRLAEVAAPTLVVSGAADVPGIREVSELLAGRIPGARYVELAETGHLPRWSGRRRPPNCSPGSWRPTGECAESDRESRRTGPAEPVPAVPRTGAAGPRSTPGSGPAAAPFFSSTRNEQDGQARDRRGPAAIGGTGAGHGRPRGSFGR